MSAVPAAGAGLDARIVAIEAEVAGLAGALGRPERADRLRAESAVARRTDLVTLVVAGETSRGKSSLVSAILGRPDLLPIDADVTTNVYTVVRHGTRERIVVSLDDGQELESGLDGLSRWVSAASNPHNELGVREVTVHLDHPLLARGIAIVDTPGVGGIESGHTDMTMVAIQGADALLFVLDAKAPISRPEQAFLIRAAERIDAVIVCLTKTDLFPEWDVVARQDREFIDRHVPRFKDAPILPTSSQLARQAEMVAARGHAELADTLRARSGIAELTATVERRVLGPGIAIRRANRLRGAQAIVEELIQDRQKRVAAASGEPAQAEAARAAAATLGEYDRSTAAWSMQVGDDFLRLELAASQALNEEIRAITSGLAPSGIASSAQGAEYARTLADRLEGIAPRLNALLTDGIAGIGDRLRTLLAVDGIELPAVALDVAVRDDEVQRKAPTSTTGDEVLRWGAVLMTIPSALALLGGTTLLGGLGVPVALASLGLATFRAMRDPQAKELAAVRDAWRVQLESAVGQLRSTVPADLKIALLGARRAMEDAAKGAIEAHRTELRREHAELTRLLEADKAEQDRAKADAQKEITTLALKHKEIAGLIDEARLAARVAEPAG